MDVDSLFSVDGKAAVITGGSRGIGFMIAEGFVRSGARVYITARKVAECEQAAEQLKGLGGSCVAIPADISTPEGRQRLVAEVTGAEPQLDVLINNAGATWGAPIDEYPSMGWEKVLGVNLTGLFELTQQFLPALRAAASPEDPARIINIGSVDGIRVPAMESYAYSASKAAVHMLTRHLATRLASEHITVNAIAPGPFKSKMMAFILDDHEEAVASQVPLGRIGRPEDMAGTALFLASTAGAYLTGTVIPVDGGIRA
jgi:NAD(P)-dependent dehydrogenase (short-subunit alcohol dehydrogenase family)